MKNCHNSDSFSLLSASPKIFYGRESELADLVDTLASEPAQIVILGPGGMGKATLAMATPHHPTIVEGCTVGYFVSCESANARAGLVTTIGPHLGLELSRQLSKAIVHHFVQCGSCLVVLDNLETSWEPLESRGQVEEFSSLLADIPGLALLAGREPISSPSLMVLYS
jgi:hypothetical protein